MKKLLALVVIFIIALVVWLVWSSTTATAPEPSTTNSAAKTTANKTANSSFNRHLFSLTSPSSLWVIVNKTHPLNPKTYEPARLVIPNIPLRANITQDEERISAVMAPALEKMVAEAKQQGINLDLQSGYRSYQFQVNLYGNYVAAHGQAKADTYSARPGYSEHQTGLAADLGGTSDPACNVAQCFAGTPEGKWLAANCYKFGFVIRYPKGFENITGYEYEPWHIRYIGTPGATEMRNTGVQTLEQFFNVSGGTSYKT